ncbi:hypothetical protein BH09GEM1_BH09GEM1_45250 [soil metagenome]
MQPPHARRLLALRVAFTLLLLAKLVLAFTLLSLLGFSLAISLMSFDQRVIASQDTVIMRYEQVSQRGGVVVTHLCVLDRDWQENRE